MTIPQPPAGSEQYREGWRDGYDQARIDRERAAELQVPPGSAHADCARLVLRLAQERDTAVAALAEKAAPADVQGAAERVIYEVLTDLAGTDAQGLADHIADALASHDLLASTPTDTGETPSCP